MGSYAFTFNLFIIAIGFSELGFQPEDLIWHPTCNRERRRMILAPRVQRLRVASPRASLANLLASLLFSGRTSQFKHAQACPEWSPTLPRLGGSHYESPSRHCPASGRSARFAGPSADYPG